MITRLFDDGGPGGIRHEADTHELGWDGGTTPLRYASASGCLNHCAHPRASLWNSGSRTVRSAPDSTSTFNIETSPTPAACCSAVRALVRIAANEIWGMVRFASAIRCGFEVLEPPELRERLHEMGARLSAC